MKILLFFLHYTTTIEVALSVGIDGEQIVKCNFVTLLIGTRFQKSSEFK